jgi:aerobic-type carbon monoxide dehydrogenase small subunit (CoxS/CutS family)
MLLAAAELVATRADSSREEIREFMSGNYCRCTGYQAIVDAIEDVLGTRSASVAGGQKC